MNYGNNDTTALLPPPITPSSPSNHVETAFSKQELEENDRKVRCVIRIQKIFRGFLVRKKYKRVISEVTSCEKDAILPVVRQMIKWNTGWLRFCANLLYFVLFILMAYYQIVASSPSSISVNDGMLDFLANNIDPVASTVNEPSDIYTYMDSITQAMYDAQGDSDFTPPDYCDDLYRKFADNTLASNSTALRLIENCLNGTVNSGFINSQLRMMVGIFVVQRRFANQPCNFPAQRKNPFRKSPSPSCLNEQQEQVNFSSSFCEANATLCSNVPHFQFNKLSNGFLFFIPSSFWNIPIDTLNNRVNELRDTQWLDASTKQVCFVFEYWNIQQENKIGFTSDCFDFTLGGAVKWARSVENMPAGGSSSGTNTGYAFSVVILFGAVMFLLRDLIRLVEKIKSNTWREFVLSFFTTVLLFAWVLAICLYYFDVLRQFRDFTPPAIDNTIFVTYPAHFDSLYKLLELLGRYSTYRSLVSVGLFLVLVRLILVLDFHSSLAIVTKTLTNAASALLTYALVFFLILCGFTAISILLFGSTNLEYSTFGSALNQLMLSILFMSDLPQVVFGPSVSLPQQKIIEGLFFWSFIILNSILLLNILLSIIVDAYVQLMEEAKSGISFWNLGQSMLMFCYFMIHNPRCFVEKNVLRKLIIKYSKQQQGPFRVYLIRQDLREFFPEFYTNLAIERIKYDTGRFYLAKEISFHPLHKHYTNEDILKSLVGQLRALQNNVEFSIKLQQAVLQQQQQNTNKNKPF